ncbi:cytochrome c biogenesis protein ResB [Micromonospora sp. NPDC003197]
MTAVADRAADPKPSPSRRPNRLLALLRNSWRQLTSMRTALVLLFLLAVAAIPGSVLPQRGVNRESVDAYFVEHPKLAPVLDRIGAFEVYASIWFSAIYLLLFTSLVGCILPRLRDHIRAIRTAPPAAPKRLDRLPQHTVLTTEDNASDARTAQAGTAEAIAAILRKRRWRVVVRDDTVSAEKGHLKETGNLLFHLSLVVVLVGVGYGSWYGWHGNRLLVAGPDKTFCNTLQQYAETGLGPQVDAADLPPFCLELTDFQATFLESGQPESYQATVNVDEGGATRRETFSVNSPLRLDGANAYLLGHGYAPIIRYTDRNGQSQTHIDPFLNIDGNMTSEGVAAFPDVNLTPTGERNLDLQVAFEGLYLPTAPDSAPFTRSQHPAERSPALMLFAYRGNLGMEAGIPNSVFKLDQRQVRTGKLKQVGEAKLLRVGEKWTLDDGTTVEFLGTRQFVTISIRHDPGEMIVLVSSGLMLVGLMLSLTGRRRRVWFRVTPTAAMAGLPPDGGPKVPISAPTDGTTTSGSSLIEAGGLPRTDYSGFAEEFEQLVAEVERGVRVREGTE